MKSNKIYAIGAIVLLVGVLVSIVAFALADFNVENLSTGGVYQEKYFDSDKEYETIAVTDNDTKVEIAPSMDGQLHVTYYDNNNEYYEISESGNGTLTIDKKSKWYNYFFNLSFGKKALSIEIPSSYNGKLKITTSNGPIDLVNLTAQDLDLKTSNGKVGLDTVSVTGNIDIQSSNGSLNLSNITATNITCHTSNAKTNLNTIEAEFVDIRSSNGKITLEDINSKGDIRVKTSNARVEFDRLLFEKEFYCKTSSGSVQGTIVGNTDDFTISSKTSNGSSNLPKEGGNGDKTIDIHTSNGSIDVDFTE